VGEEVGVLKRQPAAVTLLERVVHNIVDRAPPSLYQLGDGHEGEARQAVD